MSGLCQACQDRVYLAYDEEEGRRHPIVDGGLIATSACIGFRPRSSRCCPSDSWCPGRVPSKVSCGRLPYLTRAGPRARIPSTWSLTSWIRCQGTAAGPSGPPLRLPRLRCAHRSLSGSRTLSFLIGLDQWSLDAAASASATSPTRIATASLAEEVPWVSPLWPPVSSPSELDRSGARFAQHAAHARGDGPAADGAGAGPSPPPRSSGCESPSFTGPSWRASLSNRKSAPSSSAHPPRPVPSHRARAVPGAAASDVPAVSSVRRESSLEPADHRCPDSPPRAVSPRGAHP